MTLETYAKDNRENKTTLGLLNAFNTKLLANLYKNLLKCRQNSRLEMDDHC